MSIVSAEEGRGGKIVIENLSLLMGVCFFMGENHKINEKIARGYTDVWTNEALNQND